MGKRLSFLRTIHSMVERKENPMKKAKYVAPKVVGSATVHPC